MWEKPLVYEIEYALIFVKVQQKAQKFNLSGQTYHHVSLALAAAKNQANPDDLILICGSIFLVAEVL